MNNNNVNNANRCKAVTNLQESQEQLEKMKKDNEYFSHLVGVYFDTRKNKRYGRDAMGYENSWLTNLVRDFYGREDKSLKIDQNYAFLVSIPRWREIMATEFKGRLIDHEICEVIIPVAEKVLSPYTFNNRKGMGAVAAINNLIESIYKVTENYTKPARIIKLDIKGYFPNAMWDVAYEKICGVIDISDCEDKDYLKWMAMVAIYCNPTEHCEFRTPRFFWDEHIDPEKSIFNKPYGVGAAIGRLIWQTAMGLYINDDIKWLTEECGLDVTCFRGRHRDCRAGGVAPLRALAYPGTPKAVRREGCPAQREEILRPTSNAWRGVPRLTHKAEPRMPQFRHDRNRADAGGRNERMGGQGGAYREFHRVRQFLYGAHKEPHESQGHNRDKGAHLPKVVAICRMERCA